eukprot:6024339-Pleurochrysis_carterae.AAC.1
MSRYRASMKYSARHPRLRRGRVVEVRELPVAATLLLDHVVVHILVQRLELWVVQRLGKKLDFR